MQTKQLIPIQHLGWHGIIDHVIFLWKIARIHVWRQGRISYFFCCACDLVRIDRATLQVTMAGNMHIKGTGYATVNPDADSRNFVLCPGGAYDRSPCGTGTSAKLACLIEDGHLNPGETWRQESVIGSVFEAIGREDGNRIIPTITGSSHVTAETILYFGEEDPFRSGIL